MHKYKEEKVLGKGKFGSASLYTDISSDQKVVANALSKIVDSKQLNSFRKEIAAMHLLDHTNIIKYTTPSRTMRTPKLSWSTLMEGISKN